MIRRDRRRDRVRPGWRERDFGRLQGLSYEELFAGFPEFALGEIGIEAARTVPEGGESLLGMRERVLDAWECLLDGDEETVVVVTHGGPLYVLLGHLKDLDLAEAVLGTDYRNGAITELRCEEDSVEIRHENHIPYSATE